MTTKKEIRDRLLAIHTNFHINENEPTEINEIKMDSFGSFLTYTKRLPRNEEIKKDFEDQLKPELKKGESGFLQTNLVEKYDYDLTFNEDFFSEDDKDEKKNQFNDNAMFVAMNVAARPGKFSVAGWKNFHDQEDRVRDQNMLKMNLEVNDPMFDGCYATDAIKKVVDSNSSNVKNDFFAGGRNSELVKYSFTNHDESMNDNLRAEEYMKLDEQAARDSANQAKRRGTTDKYVKRFETEKDALEAVRKNRVIFYKSANVFVDEWKAIQPKRIIAFGGTTTALLENMLDTEVFKQYPELCKMVEDSIQITHYSYRLNLKDFYNKYSSELMNKINETSNQEVTE